MSFRVTILPSGQTFEAAGEESVLDAALRHGVTFPYGCRNGVCGSCKGQIRSGEIAYPGGIPQALSEKEMSLDWAVFCQARARSALEIEVQAINAVRDIPVRTLPCRVDGMERLAHDVMGVYLKLPDSQRLQFLAGQYVDILLRDGRRRAFSLANAPHDDARLELHVRHVPGGRFSEFTFSQMREKTLLRITGPLGNFYLRDDSPRPVILVAGGTGFAPVKGIIEHALERGLGRPMHLYWGVRARADLYMDDLARGWAQAHPQVRYTPVLSEPAPQDEWAGREGFVHEAVLRDYPDLTSHDIYVSGPPAMVHAARDSFFDAGLDPAHLYSDSFDYAYQDGHDG